MSRARTSLTSTYQILPLILRSLSLPDPTQRSNVISTLNSVLETQNLAADVDTLIHQNAAAMVENLLRSALPDLTGAMETTGVRNVSIVPGTLADSLAQQVRSAALRCLSMFPDVVRHNTLHSQKNAVLRDLGKALDDPLRSVRREAVECRAKWWVHVIFVLRCLMRFTGIDTDPQFRG